MATKYKDSGIPWIGMIPKDWTVEPIGWNISEVDNPNVGGVETNALQFKAGTIISKSKGDSKYHPETLEAYNIVDKGVIMLNGLNLSFDLISQRVGLVQERGVITSAYLAIKPNHNIDSEYLTYLFKGYDSRKALHSMGKGLRQTLAYKELKQYSVVYPPLPTQQRIADFLDRKCAEIDELAALQETMIEELKRYKQSLITETVTKGLNPNAPMKDSGVEWIGKIPEGWELTQLKRYAKVNNGKEIAVELPADAPNAKPVYGSGGIFKYTNDILFDGEAVLFGRKGTLGKPLYVNGELWVVDTMYFLTFTPSIFPKYAFYQLTAFDWTPFITQTAIPSIVASEVVANNVPVPPLSEQQQIADFLDSKCAEIDELIAIKQQKIEALKEYKKSVIFEYVTGKKEVEI